MSHIRRSAFLHILKVAFRSELRMTPIRATPARRSKPVIPPLDREHPLREAPFAAGKLRQHIHNQQFRNAAGSARPGLSHSRLGLCLSG